ncbi:MAG: hypothetical protein MI922_29010 [Bacteroidales bacterium]|nr:hypothetical protein [Bacteroidales bacterium]
MMKIRWFFRGLRLRKQDSLFNIAGLSISFVLAILFIGYIIKELNTGKTILGYENIYRMQNIDDAWISKKVFDLIGDNFPEIEAKTYIQEGWSVNRFFEVDRKNIKADGAIYASKDFFEVFQHDVIAGDLKNALKSSNGIVITESVAHRLFGTHDVIGRMLKYKTTAFIDFDLTVNAVIKDLPHNALLRFEAVVPVLALHQVKEYADVVNNKWDINCYQVFLRTKNQFNKGNLEVNVFDLIEQHAIDFLIKEYKSIHLEPYQSLYFARADNDDVIVHSFKSYVYILIVITVLILVLACINYFNLYTARLFNRLKKIGIKKTLGATRFKIILELAGESSVIVVISFLVSIVLIFFSLDVFNEFTDSSWTFIDMFSKQSGMLIFYMLLFTALICCLLPGFLIAMKNPVLLLKRITSSSPKQNKLRNLLLIFQFLISSVFIVTTLVIQKQTSYLQSRSLGIKTENILYLNLVGELNTDVLHNELVRIPGIRDITYASEVVGKITNGRGRILSVNGERKQIQYKSMQVDTSFFNFFGIVFSEGSLHKAYESGKKNIVFNETAKKAFGIDDIKMAHLTAGGVERDNVLGIAKDFNFNSLHYPLEPLGFVCEKPQKLGVAYIKIGKEMHQTIHKIQSTWDNLVPNWPLKYGFLDESLARLYHKERNFAKIMLAATILSIIIACLGILGVSVFVIEQRTKEIGIRKVNGATVFRVLTLLNTTFIKLVAVALIIAVPCAYVSMNFWLQNFAYQTRISWWIFVLAGATIIVVAICTVSWQSWRAARRNPVEALRYE